ncbi:MAG: hypothetical protein A2X64_05535 [Ignavibacteria bacterium GWF2_33_9]|nr:MAG: hypothetical protein A2X64_05535 [Ignavibacteria bacterium GWF2_33_9]
MYNYNKYLKEKSQRLRRNLTHSEKIFWNEVRARRFEGLKFIRQFPLGPFIFDFYCPEKSLLIELDGETHLEEEVRENDLKKDNFARVNGFILLRFKDEVIEESVGKVLEKIKEVVL